MKSIFVFLMLSILNFGMIDLTKKRFGEAMPITLISLTLLMYFFGLLGSFNLVTYFCILLSVAEMIYIYISYQKE